MTKVWIGWFMDSSFVQQRR